MRTLSNSAFMRGLTALAVVALCATSCNTNEPTQDPITYGETYIPYLMRTDKACYLPGQTVSFSINNLPEGTVSVRYRHLGNTLSEQPLTAKQWTWQPPAEDFQGYMAELHVVANGKDSVFATVGIDVSSDPARFPRNGFLSAYGSMSDRDIAIVIEDLNRYHINYVQYQDWHWKHHHPLGGSATQPMEVWTDIISRNCYRNTVQGYIDAAHERGMKTLFYNLGYGALEDYETDGVSREWLLYLDQNHRTPDYHPLGSPFKSSIYLVNTANTDWREFLSARNDEVYAIFDFDGWQIDQLGDRLVPVYDYAGNPVDLAGSFGPFISYMKQQQPDKRLVMNAVGQYGQQGQIATAPVDFCYTEVWDAANGSNYDAFSTILTDNYKWSNGKQTVLAAYLNYEHGQKGRGYFNTPGIIMSTAVAMAWGGTILQMGEHMLYNEYFPGDNLAMTGELKRAMITYYDFAVAYENLLRPDMPVAGANTDWFGVDIIGNDTVSYNQWGPQKGQIATVGRLVENREVIHLLSYRNATHLKWCDTNADQGEPDMLKNQTMSVSVHRAPKRIWYASPDYMQGAAIELEFTYTGGQVELTVPAIKYYTMLVFEY